MFTADVKQQCNNNNNSTALPLVKSSGDSEEDHFLCLLQGSSLLLIRNASSPSQSTCNCDALRPFGSCHVYLLDSLTEGAKGLCQFIGRFRILGVGGKV